MPPNPIGFGFDQTPKPTGSQLESSIIDSISTGDTSMLGSSLWGNSHHNVNAVGAAGSNGAGNSGGGSLLGNLIHSSAGVGNETAAVHNPDSLFAPPANKSSNNNNNSQQFGQQESTDGLRASAPEWGKQLSSTGGSIW